MKRFSPWNTVRGRLLILAIGIEMLMLTVLVFNSLRLLHDAMTNQARSQAAQYHPVLKAALTAPLAQHDYATVQAVINESRTAGEVLYIVVVDPTGKWAGSSGWPANRPLPEPSKDIPLFKSEKDPRYDVVVPISMYNQPLGTLHFGLNLSQIVSARRTLLVQGVEHCSGLTCFLLADPAADRILADTTPDNLDRGQPAGCFRQPYTPACSRGAR